MIRILERRIPWIEFTAVYPSCWCENLLPGRNVFASVGSLAETPVSAAMGAGGFAERAERELRATGERVRNRTADVPAQLTARETQISRLAGLACPTPRSPPSCS
jgi:hypothetical protein